jgi:probable blue pigment (indigoidine) exporter
MTTDSRLLLQTALAPAAWGTTYVVMTELLPPDRPLLAAVGRALPAGILLVLLFRGLPRGSWWWRAPLLGALNVAGLFAFLMVAADRLPGGVAATLGAIGPLSVALLAWPLLGDRPGARPLLAGLAAVAGVGLLVMTPSASLDPIGVAAGLGAPLSASVGLVLTRRFGPPPVPTLVATGWQLVAAGLLLLPLTLAVEGVPAAPTAGQALGFAYLAIVATAAAFALWFRGIARLAPQRVAFLVLLSPVVATVIGWLALGQALGGLQLAGMLIALASMVLAQLGGRSARPAPAQRSSDTSRASATASGSGSTAPSANRASSPSAPRRLRSAASAAS